MSNLYRFDKCLEAISIIISKEESKEYFNINDMYLLLDICLQQITRQKKHEVRVQILRLIDSIIDNPMFRNYPYKVDDIKQTIEELIIEDEGNYSQKERECLAKLNLKFQIINFK